MTTITGSRLTTGEVWSRFAGTLRALFALTKPGVTAVLVFTAVTTAWAAGGMWTSGARLGWLALAGGLMAGGAAAINQYIEREIDARMPRTTGRPLPAGRLAIPQIALGWGIALAAGGLIVSLATLPPLTTLFIVLGLVIYVPLYTLLWKPTTNLNVVLGGAAGCCPILAGWSAVRADWPITPFALAALVFFWTPAHFWAYALVHKEGYRQAGIPMLPTEIGYRATMPYIFSHALLMVIASLLAVRGIALISAAALGAGFLAQCIHLWRNPTPVRAYRLYKVSNYYLLAVFFLMTFGSLLGV